MTTDGANSLGAYAGYQAAAGVSSFGRAVGQQPGFGTEFLDGDSFDALVSTAPSYMAAWKNSGLTMVWALPMLPYASSQSSPQATAPGDTLQQGANGAYNSYFLQLAQEMVAGGEADSIIRIGWEFNGSWFPWAAAGQASAFIGYWQQIVDTMRSVAGEQFRFAWNPNLGSSNGVGNLADYYPGDAYVDDIGLDVYDQSWGYYGDPGCDGVTCQDEQFNTFLTESGGLNWLTSFASQHGKPIVLPEWGLGTFDPTDLNGSYMDEAIGGGDDPAFITDMIGWIDANEVYEAGYWDYQGDATNAAPLSAAALRSALAAIVSLTPGTSQDSTTSTMTTPTTTTPTTTTPTTTTPTTTTPTTTRPPSPVAVGGVSSHQEGAFAHPLPKVSPRHGRIASAVDIQGTSRRVFGSGAVRFTARVSTGSSAASSVAGSVRWAVNSASGAPVSCRSGRTDIRRTRGMTWCTVKPGVLSAADAPYTVSATYRGSSGVAPSSASFIQSVARVGSRIIIHTPYGVSSGGSADITAQVRGLPRSAGMATGRVTFTIRGASGASLFCIGGETVELLFGRATCQTTDVAAGASPYVVTAIYSGDKTFNRSTSFHRTIRVR